MSYQRVAAAARTAVELLDAYRPGDALLATAAGTLHTRGALTVLDRAEDLPGALRATTADGGAPALAVGALPFDPDRPAHLVVPETVRRGPGPVAAAGPAARPAAPPGGWRIEPVPDTAAYVRGVERALKLMADAEPDPATGLRKVVLARSVRLTGPGPVDLPALLRVLAGRDPSGHTFAVGLPERDGRPRTLVGASPELLVSRRGREAVSYPLAGSAPRGRDAAEDRRNSAALLASAKDRYEHALVVDAVAETLRPYCARLDVPAEPHLVRTAAMWHLGTLVRGELADPGVSALDLARALHPTPAVCGWPVGPARTAIGAIEPFDRRFYTGAVGHVDAAGDGAWVVSIRCAEVSGASLDLFAGGGIVPESDPDAELAETSAKMRTLQAALGVDQPL
ncbi:isochorismate synthase [Allonocardiopsis opalescens]|uniref:isochorismate synthase n=1 Tax=Allonocardiopsis opalescens TaxID=1144618 RepID=UPI001FE6863C|nr:isochorismate synthase [Allonocardiopsis opalescens]